MEKKNKIDRQIMVMSASGTSRGPCIFLNSYLRCIKSTLKKEKYVFPNILIRRSKIVAVITLLTSSNTMYGIMLDKAITEFKIAKATTATIDH